MDGINYPNNPDTWEYLVKKVRALLGHNDVFIAGGCIRDYDWANKHNCKILNNDFDIFVRAHSELDLELDLFGHIFPSYSDLCPKIHVADSEFDHSYSELDIENWKSLDLKTNRPIVSVLEAFFDPEVERDGLPEHWYGDLQVIGLDIPEDKWNPENIIQTFDLSNVRAFYTPETGIARSEPYSKSIETGKVEILLKEGTSDYQFEKSLKRIRKFNNRLLANGTDFIPPFESEELALKDKKDLVVEELNLKMGTRMDWETLKVE